MKNSDMETLKRIGLLDHMGFGNMGDAAIQESFIENIRSRVPDVELTAFSLYPRDTEQRHKLVCYPLGWSYPGRESPGSASVSSAPESGLKSLFKRLKLVYRVAKPVHDCVQELLFLARSYRIVKSLDLLVMSGGGQLCELYGRLPYNVFKFCLLAKLAGTRVIFVGVGADLLVRRSNRFFAKWSVRMADYISFRSTESQALIRQLGVRKETHVCPDPAYGLQVKEYLASARSEILTAAEAQVLFHSVDSHHQQTTSADPVFSARSQKSSATLEAGCGSAAAKPTVGLNPIGFCDPRRWPRKDSAAYSDYLDKLTEFSLWLLDHNYRLEIFSSDISGDIDAIQDLQERITAVSPNAELSVHPMLTLKGLLLQMSRFDYNVTSRFHGVIFSHLLATPVVALSYLPKIDHLMRAVGHDRYCLEIGTFTASALIESFQAMVAEGDSLRSVFREAAATRAGAIGAHFDELFLPKAQV